MSDILEEGSELRELHKLGTTIQFCRPTDRNERDAIDGGVLLKRINAMLMDTDVELLVAFESRDFFFHSTQTC